MPTKAESRSGAASWIESNASSPAETSTVRWRPAIPFIPRNLEIPQHISRSSGGRLLEYQNHSRSEVDTANREAGNYLRLGGVESTFFAILLMSSPDQPLWIRVLEILAWPTSFLLAVVSLGPVLSRMTLSAIPVRLEGGVSLDEIRVPVRVQAEEALPVKGAVRVANTGPLQVEARPVRVNGPVSVSVPQAVDVKAPGPIPVVAQSPVAVKAASPIEVAAPAPIPVSTGGPVTATVDVRSVFSPLKIDPATTIQVTGGLEVERIVDPIRANIRGFLLPFQ